MAHVHKPSVVRTIPILLFHRVDYSGWPWSVTPDDFRELLLAVKASGREFVSAGTAAALVRAGGRVGRKVAAITFDDGSADVRATAHPILEALGLPYTLFLTTGYVDRPGWLTAADIRYLRDAGVELGAHSRTHPHLDIVSADRVVEEVVGGKREMERLVEQPCDLFAYPHGSYRRATQRAVRSAGYTAAFAVRDASAYVGEDCFAISRRTVMLGQSVDSIAAWVASDRQRTAPRRERLRTSAFRQVRRVRHYASRREARP